MKMKPSAPVEIEALDLSQSSATLRLTFGKAAEAVAVKVYGVDGLTVRGVPSVGATFAAGEVATLPVTFVPGAGRSYLAAMVTGTFAGREDAKVVSFAIGEPTAAQRDAADANVIVDADGRRTRVQPVDAKVEKEWRPVGEGSTRCAGVLRVQIAPPRRYRSSTPKNDATVRSSRRSAKAVAPMVASRAESGLLPIGVDPVVARSSVRAADRNA